MSRAADERLETVLAEAQSLLAQGRPRDALDAFGRVLLHDPAQSAARAGWQHATEALAEERRRLDAALHAARGAVRRGDAAEARALAEEVLRGDGDRDAAQALLDCLDTPSGPGVVVSVRDTGALPLPLPAAVAVPPPRRWRRIVTVAWTLAFALLTAVVVVGWESHVARLTGTPLPDTHQALPVTHYPAPTAGERAVAEARARLQRGEPDSALRALATVHPEDPAYPLAVQIRAQADRERTAERPR